MNQRLSARPPVSSRYRAVITNHMYETEHYLRWAVHEVIPVTMRFTRATYWDLLPCNNIDPPKRHRQMLHVRSSSSSNHRGPDKPLFLRQLPLQSLHCNILRTFVARILARRLDWIGKTRWPTIRLEVTWREFLLETDDWIEIWQMHWTRWTWSVLWSAPDKWF